MRGVCLGWSGVCTFRSTLSRCGSRCAHVCTPSHASALGVYALDARGCASCAEQHAFGPLSCGGACIHVRAFVDAMSRGLWVLHACTSASACAEIWGTPHHFALSRSLCAHPMQGLLQLGFHCACFVPARPAPLLGRCCASHGHRLFLPAPPAAACASISRPALLLSCSAWDCMHVKQAAGHAQRPRISGPV